MSFQTICLAEGGVVVGYNGLETSGTALADFSGNGLDATLSTRGTLGGAAIITGTARSITASGNAGTGAVATRAVAGGSPLQLTTAMTVCGFVQGSAATPASTGGLLGDRANNWLFRRTSTRLAQLYVYAGGVITPSPMTGITPMLSGERFLVWFRKHTDGWWDIGINDGVESALYYPGNVTATTDQWTIGASSNNSFDGLMFPLAVFDHAVDLGVFRAMIREDTTMDYGANNGVGSVLFDFAGDRNPIIAASTADETCNGLFCGARIRADDARVTDSTGHVYHLACRTSKTKGHPTSITSSSTQTDYAQAIDRSTRYLINMWAHKPNAGKAYYWNGTNFVVPTNPAGLNFWNECGVGCAAAALARFLRTGPNDALMQVAYKTVELELNNHFTAGAITPGISAGLGWWENGDFSLPHSGKTLLLLKDRMDMGQWQDWVDLWLAGHDAYHLVGGSIVGSGTHHAPGNGYLIPYCINGNRDLGSLEAFMIAQFLDPTSTRVSQYQSQRSWVAAPAAISSQPGGSGSGLTYGLVTAVSPTQADGSDGKGYFREAHSSSAKGFWNNGGLVEGDANKENTNVDGYDKSYSVTQMERCTNLFVFTGEQLYARWSNMLMNQTYDSLNTTTGIWDGSYGSRHCANFTWQQSTGLVMKWRSQRATTGNLTDTFLANMFKITQSQCITHGRAPVDATGRDVTGSNLTALLMGLDAFPAI